MGQSHYMGTTWIYLSIHLLCLNSTFVKKKIKQDINGKKNSLTFAGCALSLDSLCYSHIRGTSDWRLRYSHNYSDHVKWFDLYGLN